MVVHGGSWWRRIFFDNGDEPIPFYPFSFANYHLVTYFWSVKLKHYTIICFDLLIWKCNPTTKTNKQTCKGDAYDTNGIFFKNLFLGLQLEIFIKFHKEKLSQGQQK